MTSKTKTIKLDTKDKSKQLGFANVEYLGSGAYSCEIHVESSGFMCKRDFGFDNDEFFLSKIKDVVDHEHGEAELTDLQADSFIRFKPYVNDEVLVMGYIVEHTNVTQSIEFAFTVGKTCLREFIISFENIVRASV